MRTVNNIHFLSYKTISLINNRISMSSFIYLILTDVCQTFISSLHNEGTKTAALRCTLRRCKNMHRCIMALRASTPSSFYKSRYYAVFYPI